MRPFLLALQFLTIFPIRIKNVEERHLVLSCIFFPIVGAIIGILLFVVYLFIRGLGLDSLLDSTIIIIAAMLFTGSLHLDGLADTFDALAGGRDRADKLKILRDSSIGTMGTLALFSVVILKILLLSEILDVNKLAALVAMCMIGRWSQVLAIKVFKYARDEGKAKVFFSGMTGNIFLLAGISALLFSSFLFFPQGIVIFILASLHTLIVGKALSRKFGGLTGDIIGAISEIMEVFTLFLIVRMQ